MKCRAISGVKNAGLKIRRIKHHQDQFESENMEDWQILEYGEWMRHHWGHLLHIEIQHVLMFRPQFSDTGLIITYIPQFLLWSYSLWVKVTMISRAEMIMCRRCSVSRVSRFHSWAHTCVQPVSPLQPRPKVHLNKKKIWREKIKEKGLENESWSAPPKKRKGHASCQSFNHHITHSIHRFLSSSEDKTAKESFQPKSLLELLSSWLFPRTACSYSLSESTFNLGNLHNNDSSRSTLLCLCPFKARWGLLLALQLQSVKKMSLLDYSDTSIAGVIIIGGMSFAFLSVLSLCSLIVWCRWSGEEGRLAGARRRSNNSLVIIRIRMIRIRSSRSDHEDQIMMIKPRRSDYEDQIMRIRMITIGIVRIIIVIWL